MPNITYQDRAAATIIQCEQNLSENKTCIKTYATKARAEAEADKLSNLLAQRWEVFNAPVEVLQLSNGRYFAAPDLNFIVTESKRGGYVGDHLDRVMCFLPDIPASNILSRAA